MKMLLIISTKGHRIKRNVLPGLLAIAVPVALVYWWFAEMFRLVYWQGNFCEFLWQFSSRTLVVMG